MKTLTIQDLPQSENLDRQAMRAVRGGMHRDPSPYWRSFYEGAKHGFFFDAAQKIDQGQEIVSNNGNEVAFSAGIRSQVKPSQYASNSISF